MEHSFIKEFITANKGKIKKLAVCFVIAVIALICYNILLGYNSATQLLVKQSPNGSLSCIDHAGFYFKGPFTSIYSYDRTKDFYFNSSTEKVKGEGWEGGDDDEDDISVTLSRNANADISGYLKYQLPTDCDDLIKIHKEQRSDKKLKHDLIRNSVLSAVRKTAPIFTAEEAKVTKVAEFRRLAEDQLIDGEYLTTIEILTEKAGDDEIDSTGKIIKKAETQEYKVTKLKMDENGNRILTKPSALKQYGIKILQFEIQSVKLDSMAQQQLDIVKDREMKRVARSVAAETAKQDAITAEAEGKAKIAKERADQEAVKIRVITQMEKSRDSAIIVAQQEREVARLNAEKAKFIADSTKQAGIAEAEANKAKVMAGLTPQEKAEWDYKTKVGVAEALAKSTHPLVPEIMFSGDSKGGAGTAMDAVGLNMLMDLTNKLSNK